MVIDYSPIEMIDLSSLLAISFLHFWGMQYCTSKRKNEEIGRNLNEYAYLLNISFTCCLWMFLLGKFIGSDRAKLFFRFKLYEILKLFVLVSSRLIKKCEMI